MISKGITLLEKTGVFKYDIHEWRQQSANLKTWAKYKFSFHQSHQDQKRAVTTSGKGGGVHRNGENHIRCTTSPLKIAPWDDIRHTNNCAGDASTEIWAGRTGTSQCIPYQLELHGNGKVGTDDWDHERHAGTIKNTHICANQTIKIKMEAVLLELWEKIHYWEQKLIRK